MYTVKFKDFIKDEGLDKNKKKSTIRIGWDGRQDEVDYYVDLNDILRVQAMDSFERFEKERASVVKLDELVELNKVAVAKSKDIHEQNVELLEENKKINKALANIAQDIAKHHIILQSKDNRIQELEDKLAGK